MIKISKDKLLNYIAYLVLTIALLLPVVFAITDLTVGVLPSDSSVFRYIGWRVSCFDGCYSVAFDHKGPVIFLVHALGYWITPHSELGVDVIYTLMWGYVIFTIFQICRRLHSALCGGVAALFFSLVGLTNICGCFDDIEITALFFGMVMLSFSGLLDGKKNVKMPSWRYLVCGVLASMVFMTKANLVALPGAIFLTWMLDAFRTREYKKLGVRIVWSGIGFVVVTIVLFGMFGFKDTWDAAFAFNMFEYRNVSNRGVVQFWIDRLFSINNIWAAWLLLGWWGMIVFNIIATLVFGRLKSTPYVLLMVWMVVETISAIAFKGFFEHYAILSLAVTSILFFSLVFSIKYRIMSVGIICCVILYSYIDFKWFVGGLRARSAERELVDKMLIDVNRRFPAGSNFAIWARFNIMQLLVDAKSFKPPQRYFQHDMKSIYKTVSTKRGKEIIGELTSALKNRKVSALLLEPGIDGRRSFEEIVKGEDDLIDELEQNWVEEKRDWGYILVPRKH